MLNRFAVIDDDGIIQYGESIEFLISIEGEIRAENPDIKGDLKYIEIHHVSN